MNYRLLARTAPVPYMNMLGTRHFSMMGNRARLSGSFTTTRLFLQRSPLPIHSNTGHVRTLVSLPRLTLTLLRLPVAAANQWLSDIDFSNVALPDFGIPAGQSHVNTPVVVVDAANAMSSSDSLLSTANLDHIKATVANATGSLFGKGVAGSNGDAIDSVDISMMASADPNLTSGVHHAASQGPSMGSSSNSSNNQDLLGLTSKLIEIRNLLKSVDTGSSALTLPSIVVIGSQSSGKSSVLEAIVGHEFLPKGSNMVTRRPIELTLIHTPDTKDEYSEFPQLGLGKVHDFSQVRRTLTDLNLAVSETECVSDVPIELRIYSPNVPDLTLVDLPGYIQIHTKDQPPILKEKITSLCQKYIREPNIILAVCAADVDLANSEALRASRRMDPLGLRTIGVITKMDLVEPHAAVGILENKSYPLALGYIGVVNKAPTRSFSQALIRADDSYFRNHPEFNNSMVGTATLRRRLMQVLEEHMGRSLHSIVDACQTELDNSRYEFKVHYNDRSITPESYVAESMDVLKQNFKRFTLEFGKPQLREQVRTMLEDKLLKIYSPYWKNKLDISSATLTKSGVGKATVQLVVDLLTSKMEDITSSKPWNFHDDARQQILQFSAEILRSKFHTTVDQVENTIKPYKFEVDCTDLEWYDGQKRAASIMESQISAQQAELQDIKTTIGRRRLRQTIKQISKLDKDASLSNASSVDPNTPTSPSLSRATNNNGVSSFSSFDLMASQDNNSTGASADSSGTNNAHLLARARQALQLQSGLAVMQQRLLAVKSRQCASPVNRVACPEVYLSVVSEKLAYTSVMFIYLELLSEFFFHLPREMDNRMYYGLSRDQIRKFARENPTVLKHLDIQERKATLELVMEKLKSLTRSRK
ncbi:hypothetical protein BSLG_009256 [Batrachochytrium salamandrivorans]|nr:hypothetical protein BSLG_009256 [Batrachochytrium salamandrivorans]